MKIDTRPQDVKDLDPVLQCQHADTIAEWIIAEIEASNMLEFMSLANRTKLAKLLLDPDTVCCLDGNKPLSADQLSSIINHIRF